MLKVCVVGVVVVVLCMEQYFWEINQLVLDSHQNFRLSVFF